MSRHKNVSPSRRARLADLASRPFEKFSRVLQSFLNAAPLMRASAAALRDVTPDPWENLGRAVVALRSERCRRRRDRKRLAA